VLSTMSLLPLCNVIYIQYLYLNLWSWHNYIILILDRRIIQFIKEIDKIKIKISLIIQKIMKWILNRYQMTSQSLVMWDTSSNIHHDMILRDYGVTISEWYGITGPLLYHIMHTLHMIWYRNGHALRCPNRALILIKCIAIIRLAIMVYF